MGKLDRLMAKKEKLPLDLGNGETLELELSGLKFPQLAEFAKYADSKDYTAALNYLLFTALRSSMPTKEKDADNGYTDDELKSFIEGMDGAIAMKIVTEVQRLSGLLGKGGGAEQAQPQFPAK